MDQRALPHSETIFNGVRAERWREKAYFSREERGKRDSTNFVAQGGKLVIKGRRISQP